MSSKYFPDQFERKWIENWEKEKTYRDRDTWHVKLGTKKYVLSMFPYPSGAGLHVGHVRIYTGTDILARYFRMKGHSVLHPMGWDAFGLPAENAAIAAKKNPIDMVPEHISNFKRQMQMMGFSYDWSREFATTDAEYYKWTQWLFIQFYKAGLLYKKNTDVNFCPKCKTGLAEEEVTAEGTHERCGTPITKKQLPQWMFRITKYADRLLSDLEGLDWPKGILEMQRNWIGKSQGVEICFNVANTISLADELATSDRNRGTLPTNRSAGLQITPGSLAQTDAGLGNSVGSSYEVKVFTTRPDTILGVTFLAISPERAKELMDAGWKPEEKVKKYIEKSLRLTAQDRMKLGEEKTGEGTGLMAENPANGEKVPVYVADYVLGEVGTGAIMGVPAYDEHDAEFAKEFGLPITKAPLTDKKFGEPKVKYKLRDWIFSRQRYWGEPIPMIFCGECAKNQINRKSDRSDKPDKSENQRFRSIRSSDVLTSDLSETAGWFPVPDENLPVELPYVKSYEVGEDGESPLAKIKDWVNVKCPNCGGPARRETDTMPNWAGSCWYFIRFAWPIIANENLLADELAAPDGNRGTLPTNRRASLKVTPGSLAQTDAGLVNPVGSVTTGKLTRKQWDNLTMKQSLLPVDWYIGGAEHAVLHLLYARFWVKAMNDLGLVDFTEPFKRLRNVGIVLAEDHRKMSKSFGNVINPDDVVKEYGADTLRVYESFMAPFDGQVEWSTKAVAGSYRFLQRIWQIYHSSDKITELKNEEDKTLVAELQRLILKISTDITNVKFNTCISGFMQFLNLWESASSPKENLISKFSKSSVHSSQGKLGSVVGTSPDSWIANETRSHPISSNIPQIPTSIASSGRPTRTNFNNGAMKQFSNRKLSTGNAKVFLKLLAPFAPFITEEIWREVFGEKESIHLSAWPEADASVAKKVTITIPVQVNGRVRSAISYKSLAVSKEEVLKLALKDGKVKKWVEGKKYEVIYVPGKILNLVTGRLGRYGK